MANRPTESGGLAVKLLAIAFCAGCGAVLGIFIAMYTVGRSNVAVRDQRHGTDNTKSMFVTLMVGGALAGAATGWTLWNQASRPDDDD